MKSGHNKRERLKDGQTNRVFHRQVDIKRENNVKSDKRKDKHIDGHKKRDKTLGQTRRRPT